MLILFDHGTPAPLIPFLEGQTVTKAKDARWDKLVNGELLNAAPARAGAIKRRVVFSQYPDARLRRVRKH